MPNCFRNIKESTLYIVGGWQSKISCLTDSNFETQESPGKNFDKYLGEDL